MEKSNVKKPAAKKTSATETLVQWDTFQRELANAETLTQVKALADKAKAIEVYCSNAKKGLPAVNLALCWWLRAARRAGVMLAAIERERTGGPKLENKSSQRGTTYQKTLKNVGLLKNTAHRWQQLTLISERDFETFLRTYKSQKDPISMAALLKLLPEEEPEIEELPPLPPGRYRLLYADPPWEYEFSRTSNRRIERKYPVLSLADICNYKDKKDRPIKDLGADDSTLFLWVTSPKLEEAFTVINSWEFEYKTCMVWVKDRIGMGYYARQKHELLLIAKRGNPPVPEPECRPDSVITAPRREHSQKPVGFYEALEKMYPQYPHKFFRSWRCGL